MEHKLTMDMVKRYYQLSNLAKDIESELNELKNCFHQFFDSQVGADEKGEFEIGEYKIQRQIRESESYHDLLTVKVLEELNLSECIETVKKPNKEKIDSAILLGLLNQEDLKECINRRITKAIVVKKV